MAFDPDPRLAGGHRPPPGAADPRLHAGAPGGAHADPRPTGSILMDAIDQLTRLVRGEVALAKAEVAQNLRNAGVGVGLLVGAVVIVLVALNVLAVALVGALAEWMGPGWAALLVGVVLLAVAAVLAMRGISSLKPENLAPNRTIRNVQADAQTIKETVTHDR